MRGGLRYPLNTFGQAKCQKSSDVVRLDTYKLVGHTHILLTALLKYLTVLLE